MGLWVSILYVLAARGVLGGEREWTAIRCRRKTKQRQKPGLWNIPGKAIIFEVPEPTNRR